MVRNAHTEASPADTKTMAYLADRFYEMHTICEQELDLTLREKHLVSLGHLLYSNPEGFMIGAHLKNIEPRLYIQMHEVMVDVCFRVQWMLSQQKIQVTADTLNEYLSVKVALEGRLMQLKRAVEL